MKIRKHRKREWAFKPCEESNLKKRYCTFKYKSDLDKFLTNHFFDSLYGVVSYNESNFNSFYNIREYFVWYNEKEYSCGADLKIVLKQLDFRGKKYITKPYKISKEDKRYFAFSDKVINLMCDIEDENGNIPKEKAQNLVKLFYKRGFKDFIPTEEDQKYIDYYIENGVDFFHWSDRCNWLRTKTIIEYFKHKNLI